MAETRSILWRFLGDSKSLDQASKRGSKSMGTLAKAAGTLGVALGAGQLVRGIGSAVSRAEEMDSKYEITAQILEQTGFAAGLTAEEIEEMSAQMSKTTGLDKAIVTDAANVLLTFKELKDVAGENNDVFSRGLRLTGDMATVFGGSAKDAAKQLGKALNDPILGMTALSRVGVQFTEQQKDQIKVLQESGDLLGAQKIVLAEVESQVGGTAEASADASEKIKRVGDEMIEAFGKPLLDVLVEAESAISDTGDSAETMAGQAGEAVVEAAGFSDGLAFLKLKSDDSASALDKLKGGFNILSGTMTGAITDALGFGGALRLPIETGNQLKDRLADLTLETQNWRQAQWDAQGQTEETNQAVFDGADDYREFADGMREAKKELADLSDMLDIFVGDLFKLGDKRHAENVRKLFAGGGGSGQVDDDVPGRAAGGLVPGMTGTPQTIVAHGGERVIGMGSDTGGGGVNLTVNMGVVGDPDSAARAIADLMTRYEMISGTRRSGIA